METFESADALIRRFAYRSDGRRLLAWTIRPRLATGPLPVLVVNHGSGLEPRPDGALGGTPERPTVDPASPAWQALGKVGWLFLLPEGRGYGGSDGEDPRKAAATGADGTMGLLRGRAADANAALDHVLAHGGAAVEADAARVAITGSSHGGVVTILAAAARPYAAAVPQAVGACYGTAEFGAVELANAAARIRCPLLFQHMRTDTLVPMQGARRIFEWSSRFRPAQRWRDYEGAHGVEGHAWFHPRNRAAWFPDYRAHLHAGFGAGLVAPQDPPERMTDATLAFALPDGLPDGAPRWEGRFGEGPGAVATMLVLHGDRAVYAWKEGGSRGYAHVPASWPDRERTLLLEPWPGTTIRYARRPDDEWDAAFSRNGVESRARLRRSSP